MFGPRGVEFSLRPLHPRPHRFDAHPLGQTRQGGFATHAFRVHNGGDGGIVGEPADVAEAFALDPRGQGEAVDHFAPGRGVGAGAGDRATLCKAFDDPEVFEEAAPSHQATVSSMGRVSAGEGEFARQGVEREGVRKGISPFSCQGKGINEANVFVTPNSTAPNPLCPTLQLRKLGSTHHPRSRMAAACGDEVAPATAAARWASSLGIPFTAPPSCVPSLHGP